MNHIEETRLLESIITSAGNKLQLYPSLSVSKLIKTKYQEYTEVLKESGYKTPSLSKWLCFQLEKALS